MSNRKTRGRDAYVDTTSVTDWDKQRVGNAGVQQTNGTCEQ